VADSRSTTDHNEIRRWAEENGGRPARVIGCEAALRIDFPGEPDGEDLESISWEEFFDTFEQERMVFLFREQRWVS
jgi:hypothetical protein